MGAFGGGVGGGGDARNTRNTRNPEYRGLLGNAQLRGIQQGSRGAELGSPSLLTTRERGFCVCTQLAYLKERELVHRSGSFVCAARDALAVPGAARHCYSLDLDLGPDGVASQLLEIGVR
jgi:hypothetical protein